ANAGAGVVVSKLGTSVVAADELAEALRSTRRSASDGKLKSLAGLVEEVSAWKKNGLEVGFTNGCFDLLHPGHVHLIEQARAECDRLIVGLNSDASVTRLKGEGRPIYDENARATLLSSLGSVDAVVVFEQDTPLELIQAILPTVLIKGSDYSRETVVGHEIVEAAGGRVFLAELKDGFSTTSTVERLS
ncbi:MAG: D-glycero-beta-D-manno-heptose 1-phosphate adenylyltransferase, partial [Verrucomicrobiota bacterium]